MKTPSLRPLARWALLAAGATLFAACAKNPAASNDTSKQDEASALAQSESDSAAAAMLLPAYRLNREASAHARLTSMKSGSEAPKPSAPALAPALGAPPSGPAKRLAPKQQPNIAAALLKRAALGKASAAGASDSSWFVLADSALGHILWVRAFLLSDSGTAVEARDTLVYKWPYSPDNRTVLGQAGARAFANGTRQSYAVSDEDGDGLLNEAVPGAKVKLRKQWITIHGDTAWKSVHHTVHGNTGLYDTIGPGLDTGWTDTVFVGGKLASWQRYMDGDKDGFVLTAAAGKQVRVNRDSYADLGGGLFQVDQEAFGPGADGDFLKAADNEAYPSVRQTLDADGHTLALTRQGDGDGDGFYFDPAAGADGNRAWIVNQYPASDTAKAWSDSLAQILPGPAGADAKIAYYRKSLAFADGRKLTAFTRAPGKDAFGGTDTVQYWEKWDWTGWNAGGGADSSLKVTWMLPGDLADPSDDRISRTFSQTWYAPGQPLVYVTETLNAGAAFAPGQAPQAGDWTREERRNPVSSKSVIRSVQYREFDLPKAKVDWRSTDYFESGATTESNGGGAPDGTGVYARDLGTGARSTGSYDAATGAFADTTAFLGAAGETKDREIAWGEVDAAKGTCDYHAKRLGGRDTATVRVTAVIEGKGISLTRAGASDTVRMHLEGDSAVMVKTLGGVKRTYAWAEASGAYRVSETDVDAEGKALATGEYFFGKDLSGNGTVRKTPPGKTATEANAQFLSDGSVYLGGIRVSP
jgi:hypothetical protein